MPGTFFTHLSKTYGQTFDTGVLGEVFIITTDPIIMKHMLTKGFANYEKGAFFNKVSLLSFAAVTGTDLLLRRCSRTFWGAASSTVTQRCGNVSVDHGDRCPNSPQHLRSPPRHDSSSLCVGEDCGF